MFLKPQPRFRFYGAPHNYFAAIGAALTRRVTAKKDVTHTEDILSEQLGGRDVVLTQQCRVAMYLALNNLDCKGKKIILSPYTIYDVVNMVICAGAIPTFCDIDDTCNLDIKKAKALVDDNTAGILVTHLHGRMADAQALRRFCDEKGIWLMEDAAQSFAAVQGGAPAGTIGHHGVYSFGRAKNVNSFFGGALVTEDNALAKAVRQELDTFPKMEPGRLYKRILSCLINDLATAPILFQLITFPILRMSARLGLEGLNKVMNTENSPVRRTQLPDYYRRQPTGLQARIIARQLKQVHKNNQARIRAANRYASLLADIEQIKFAPALDDGSDVYMYFPIRVDDREALTKALMADGVDVAIQHYHNTADLDVFQDIARECLQCRQISQDVVLLPTYPAYTDASIDRTVSAIRSFFESDHK